VDLELRWFLQESMGTLDYSDGYILNSYIYIKYEFTEMEINRKIRPKFVISTIVLSNDALKQAKLQRHLNKVHPTLKDRRPEYFEKKLNSDQMV